VACLSDLAGADDANGAAIQIKAPLQPLQRKVPLAHAVVHLMEENTSACTAPRGGWVGPGGGRTYFVDPAVEGHDEGHGVLGHGMWRVGRHVRHLTSRELPTGLT
jgi:hypothetical protein